MRKKYTRQQITEAIRYWNQKLVFMNEATAYEMSIANNIRQILANKYSSFKNIDVDTDIKLYNGRYNPHTNEAPELIQIWASGKSDTSDIYIVIDPSKKGLPTDDAEQDKI